jgi:hypothetical protein
VRINIFNSPPHLEIKNLIKSKIRKIAIKKFFNMSFLSQLITFSKKYSYHLVSHALKRWNGYELGSKLSIGVKMNKKNV